VELLTKVILVVLATMETKPQWAEAVVRVLSVVQAHKIIKVEQEALVLHHQLQAHLLQERVAVVVVLLMVLVLFLGLVALVVAVLEVIKTLME
jgi:hypothetical protein